LNLPIEVYFLLFNTSNLFINFYERSFLHSQRDEDTVGFVGRGGALVESGT